VSIPPAAQRRLLALLADELRTACTAALDGGCTPSAVAELLADRAAVLRSLVGGDDGEHRTDDPVDLGGVGEEGG
jgi:hypothetical protein